MVSSPPWIDIMASRAVCHEESATQALFPLNPSVLASQVPAKQQGWLSLVFPKGGAAVAGFCVIVSPGLRGKSDRPEPTLHKTLNLAACASFGP